MGFPRSEQTWLNIIGNEPKSNITEEQKYAWNRYR